MIDSLQTHGKYFFKNPVGGSHTTKKALAQRVQKSIKRFRGVGIK